jgi:hypothetical protein
MMYVILPTCAWIAIEFLIAHMTVLQALPMLLEIVYMCWLLLFGGTVALNYYRFNQFMNDCLREFFSSASSLGVQG